jgi:hypothetical protein
MSFGFIIPACIWEEKHLIAFQNCVQSIRKFHPESLVLVVQDISSTLNIPEQYQLKVVKYQKSAAADMLAYKCFLESELDTAMILQDSMRLLQPVELDYTSVKYLWSFTNHRTQWNIIEEPQTEENIKHKIRVHDDLILFCINNYTSGEFQNYSRHMLYNKHLWVGCFGTCSIMTKSFLQIMQERTGIIDTMESMGNNNRNRRAIESIFALAVQYTYGAPCYVYDGLYYDGNGGGHGLKGEKIEKVTFDRDPVKRVNGSG